MHLKHLEIRQYCDRYVQRRLYVTRTSFFLFSITLKSFYKEKMKRLALCFQAPYCSHLRIPHGRIQQRALTVLRFCIKCNTASRIGTREGHQGAHHYIHLVVVQAASASVTYVKKIDITDKQSVYKLSVKGFFLMDNLENSRSWLACRTLLQYPHHHIYTASDGILFSL